MSDLLQNRIVIKVGTSTLTHPTGGLNLRNFDRLARVLTDIKNRGFDVILVSSGAIAVGQSKLRLESRPSELRFKQAAAAVGQCELMHLYDKFFGEYGATVAQILLTGDDIELEEKKQNLVNTFDTLLEMGIIPIVNENDSVSYTEIESEQKLFGDNDTLSATVSYMCRAGKLVLLSDIDGLYESDPRQNPDARMIREVHVLDSEIFALASGAGSSRGTGGMITKLEAAAICMGVGIDMYITNGSRLDELYCITDGGTAGTLFVGRK